MQTVTVVNERMRAEMLLAEMLLGKGNAPSYTGELLAVNPTRELFATFDENFAECVADGHIEEEIVDGVVYFDTGAKRAFIVDHKYVEISPVN